MGRRIAIVGSRDFPDESVVRGFVQTLTRDDTVISGGARGVDSWAVDEAKKWGLQTVVFEPAFKRNGTRYRPQDFFDRNIEIIEAADEVVAFWHGSSRGTHHAINEARKRSKPTTVIRPVENERYAYTET